MNRNRAVAKREEEDWPELAGGLAPADRTPDRTSGGPAHGRAEGEDPRQRGLMLGSLFLLLMALSIVVWHDRDFWFPDSPEADGDQAAESAPVAKSSAKPAIVVRAPAVRAPAVAAPVRRKAQENAEAAQQNAANGSAANTPAGPVVASRTVLPPLEVEVVAGDSHRVVRPGSNSVRVDLQPGTAPQAAPEAGSAGDDETAGSVTHNAAERVQVSSNTSAAVDTAVRPNYPLLARQMKVQGSVVLQALIGRDGTIQNLRVVSGPQILASAAEDAVRQWHFKPHYQGSEAVETEAKITVNFTISTN